MAFETIANDYGLIGKVAIVSGAGGPVGAAGALLFSQLFKGQLQGLARIYYRITGSWSDPVVERISATAGSSETAGTGEGQEKQP